MKAYLEIRKRQGCVLQNNIGLKIYLQSATVF